MKKDDNLPEIDESLLTPGQKAELEKAKHFPWSRVIFFGVLFLLMGICLIVIYALGGPLPN